MNRKRFQLATALMWLALPLTALRYGLVWDQLPARMATHFAASSEPNGWMPRQVSLYFALGVTAFMLAIFTAILSAAQRQNHAQTFTVALLAFFYLATAVMFHINDRVVRYNLTGGPGTNPPLLLALPLVLVVFAGLYLRFRRGAPLPPAAPLAEEVHGSYLWALVFGAFTTLYFSLMASISGFGVRALLLGMGMLFLLITAQAWNGFHYRFSPAGLEIRTLGFRLRSIPSAAIRGTASSTGIRSAATASAASEAPGLTFGAPGWCTSPPTRERCFLDTTIRRASCGTWTCFGSTPISHDGSESSVVRRQSAANLQNE